MPPCPPGSNGPVFMRAQSGKTQFKRYTNVLLPPFSLHRRETCNSRNWILADGLPVLVSSVLKSDNLQYKSVNLQYNTLGRLDNGTNESSTKHLMFQVLFFFMISCKIICKNPFNLFSHFFIKLQKIRIKGFQCPKYIKSVKK